VPKDSVMILCWREVKVLPRREFGVPPGSILPVAK
jgi:hypothetical protein